MLLVVVAGLVVATSTASTCHAPSLARCEPVPDVGAWPWAVWVLAVIWLTMNSVNFTDGLDGLLIGCSVPPLSLLAAIAYGQHRHPTLYDHTEDALQIAIVLTAMVGGCLGLLWWNAAPATARSSRIFCRSRSPRVFRPRRTLSQSSRAPTTPPAMMAPTSTSPLAVGDRPSATRPAA